MQSMLQIARNSIRSAWDQARAYAHKGQPEVTFNEGDIVFLKVPAHFEDGKM